MVVPLRIGETTSTRRAWCVKVAAGFGGGIVLKSLLAVSTVRAETTSVQLTVYKDPSCGCCTKWVAHLRANGFTPTVRDRGDMETLKDRLGVPVALRSCHTAVLGRFLIEGHVPASDMKRLLLLAPSGVAGLAVPGMPAGSTRMETPRPAERYD